MKTEHSCHENDFYKYNHTAVAAVSMQLSSILTRKKKGKENEI